MPASRPSPAVYRRRRLVVLIGILVVVALIWWGIAALTGRSPETPPEASASAPAADTAETSPPAATPTVEPPPTSTGPIDCTAEQVQVVAHTDHDRYAAGELPQLSMSLRNTSSTACILNVGTAVQQYVITSGSDTIWRSTDCQKDPADQRVTLEPGVDIPGPAVSWSRERSSTTTCDASRPAAQAGEAYYQLVVTVGGIASEPVTFVLV